MKMSKGRRHGRFPEPLLSLADVERFAGRERMERVSLRRRTYRNGRRLLQGQKGHLPHLEGSEKITWKEESLSFHYFADRRAAPAIYVARKQHPAKKACS